MKIANVIGKLEKAQRELADAISALREMSATEPRDGSDLSWDEHEKRLLVEALARAEGNQTAAARILKLSRDKLRYKIAKHGLSRGSRRAAGSP